MGRWSESRSRTAWRCLAAVATALWLAAASVAVAAPATAARRARPAPPRPAQIESILLRETASGARLELAIDGAFDWTADRDGSGNVVIVLSNTRPAYGVVSRAFAGGLVAEYRLQSIGVPSRPVIRLLLVTRAAVETHVATAGGRLEIEVAPPAAPGARIPPPPAARPPAPAIVPPAPPAAIESEELVPAPAAPAARLDSAPIERLTTPLAPAPRLAWIEPAAPPPMAPAAEIEALAIPAPPAPRPVVRRDAELPPRIAWTEIAVAPPPVRELAGGAAALPPPEGEAPPAVPLAAPVEPLSPANPPPVASPPPAIEVSDLELPLPRAAVPRPTAPAQPAPAGPPTSSAALPAPPPRQGPARRLAAIERLADGAVRLSGDGDFTFTAFRLENPERFVIDLVGVVNQSASDSLTLGDGVLLQIRVAQYRTDPRPVTRVVFNLRAPAVPAIERVAGALVVRFGAGRPTVSALPAGRPAPRVAAAVAAAATAYSNPRRTTP